MTKLKHPFPDEPFGYNAFMVLFGRDALRASMDMAQTVIGSNDDGSLILSPKDPEAVQHTLELCAAHSGTTVDEVKTFLANPRGDKPTQSSPDKVLMPPNSPEEMIDKRRRLWSD